jgi:hypothetical protein
MIVTPVCGPTLQRRLLLRVDASDLFSLRHPTDSDSIQVSSGLGWRF